MTPRVKTPARCRPDAYGTENFWALLKRGLRGTYVAVEPFHLDRYVDEQVFRFNNRAIDLFTTNPEIDVAASVD